MLTPSETQGQFLYDLADRQWDIPRLRDLLENILPQGTAFSDFEVEHDFKQLGHRTMLLNARRVDDVHLILLAIEDVTERKQAEEATRRLAAIVDSTEDAVIGKTLEGTVTSWNAGAEKLYGYSAAEMLGKPLSLLVPTRIGGRNVPRFWNASNKASVSTILSPAACERWPADRRLREHLPDQRRGRPGRWRCGDRT